MADETIPKSAARTEDEKRHDNKEKKQTKDNTKKSMHLQKISFDRIPKPIRTIAPIVLGDLVLAIWMLADYFASGPLIVCSGILFFFAILFITWNGIHNVIKSTEFQENYQNYTLPVYVGTFVFCVVLFIVFAITLEQSVKNARIADRERRETHDVLTNLLGQVTNCASHDYLPGTKITQTQLLEAFPFGYAVLYMAKDKSFTYNVFKNGLFDWKIDFDQVKIEPDFSAGTVKWTMPMFFSAGGMTFNYSKVYTVSPFKVGAVGKLRIGGGKNDPGLFVTVLSTDQRSPVFAMGFRIGYPHHYHPVKTC
jgi:hypothetical protein